MTSSLEPFDSFLVHAARGRLGSHCVSSASSSPSSERVRELIALGTPLSRVQEELDCLEIVVSFQPRRLRGRASPC